MADNKNITICSLHKIFFFNSSTTYKIQKLKQLDNIKIKRAFIIKKRNRRIKKSSFQHLQDEYSYEGGCNVEEGR